MWVLSDNSGYPSGAITSILLGWGSFFFSAQHLLHLPTPTNNETQLCVWQLLKWVRDWERWHATSSVATHQNSIGSCHKSLDCCHLAECMFSEHGVWSMIFVLHFLMRGIVLSCRWSRALPLTGCLSLFKSSYPFIPSHQSPIKCNSSLRFQNIGSNAAFTVSYLIISSVDFSVKNLCIFISELFALCSV